MYDPANRRLGMREADTNLMMFGFYIWNNVRIGFQTFAGGLLVRRRLDLVPRLERRGHRRGRGLPHADRLRETFWSFVAGHSSLELIAIVLSGAAGLRLGLAVIAPGNLQPQGGAGRRGEAGGAHDVRRGGDVLRRRLRRGVLVAAHRSSASTSKIAVGHRRLGAAARLLRCSPGAPVQPADIAIALRRRSPWEAIDLGLAMLQRWWRPVYAAARAGRSSPIAPPGARARLVRSTRVWLAMLVIWWLKPLYDRVVLHVLSRAVFGEVPTGAPGARRVARMARHRACSWRSPSTASTSRARSTCRCASSKASAAARRASARARARAPRAQPRGVAHGGLGALRGRCCCWSVGRHDRAAAAGAGRARAGGRRALFGGLFGAR